MFNLTAKLLASVGFPEEDCDALLGYLNKYGINTPLRVAHFYAQVAHETQGFARLTENLNYAETALCNMFSAFTPALAAKYGRNAQHAADQVMIASIAYANRYGNGDISSQDGYKFRGRGWIQTTFRENYAAVGYEDNPGALASAPAAIDAACRYWINRGLNKAADADNIKQVTKGVNSALAGIADRSYFLIRAKRALGVV